MKANLVMYYAPIGLGAYFAYLVGSFGTDLLVAVWLLFLSILKPQKR